MQNFILIYISLTKDLANTFWYVLIFWGFQCADFNVLGLLSCQLWKIPELIFHSTIKPSQKSLSLCTFSDSLTLFLTSCIASSMSCFHTVYHLPLKAPCYKHLLRWGERWSNTGLYKTILDYIRLYRTIQDYTGLYRTIQHYISLYRTIYDSLFHSENWEQTHTQTHRHTHSCGYRVASQLKRTSKKLRLIVKMSVIQTKGLLHLVTFGDEIVVRGPIP